MENNSTDEGQKNREQVTIYSVPNPEKIIQSARRSDANATMDSNAPEMKTTTSDAIIGARVTAKDCYFCMIKDEEESKEKEEEDGIFDKRAQLQTESAIDEHKDVALAIVQVINPEEEPTSDVKTTKEAQGTVNIYD